MKHSLYKRRHGFTVVELLIVIVVIAILAAITIVAYNGVQDRARDAKVKTDIAMIIKAVTMARDSTQKTLFQITSYSYTAGTCVALTAGTDLATLPRTDSCWVRYLTALNLVSTASGMNISNLVDPWGRPYFIDENEGESSGCGKDAIAVYALPTNGGNKIDKWTSLIPLSGYSGCTI